MSDYNRWSYYTDNDFVENVKVEEEISDFKLYEYFSGIQWKWCNAIVYKDTIIREGDNGSLYEEWSMVIDIVEALQKEGVLQ